MKSTHRDAHYALVAQHLLERFQVWPLQRIHIQLIEPPTTTIATSGTPYVPSTRTWSPSLASRSSNKIEGVAVKRTHLRVATLAAPLRPSACISLAPDPTFCTSELFVPVIAAVTVTIARNCRTPLIAKEASRVSAPPLHFLCQRRPPLATIHCPTHFNSHAALSVFAFAQRCPGSLVILPVSRASLLADEPLRWDRSICGAAEAQFNYLHL